MMWNPWDQFKEVKPDNAIIPIDEPPCPSCIYWLPAQIIKFVPKENGVEQVVDSIQCCHTPKEMERDFSCYNERTIK